MDNFFNKIKNRENFYLDKTTEPINSTSDLLNNSIFSQKWYLYDVDIYKMFVEDYGHDFDKYINGNDDDIERCYLFTNANHTNCGLNCILGEKLEELYDDDADNELDDDADNELDDDADNELNDVADNELNDVADNELNDVDKIKQYISENKLIREDNDDLCVVIKEDRLDDLLKKEWYCFLCYEYFDGQHNAYWIINTNKDSPLFEYVFVCGMSDSTDLFDFFHFSKMDEKMEAVEKYSKDFELLKD